MASRTFGATLTLAATLSVAFSAAVLGSPSAVSAQQAAPADTAPAACARTAPPRAPTPDQRRAARDLAARAQEAAIVSNDSSARDLYERAARLDPTDPAIAYALARSYETGRDARAIGEYCRFLALQPAAPEAADVRRRVAALTYELTPRTAAAATNVAPPSPPAPGAALAYGIVFPGGGQYYTHRPALGILVTGATAGALYYAFQPQTRTVMATAIDPNGKPYQYPVTRRERSNVGAGVGAAAAISLLAAIEASSHARSARRAATVARTAIVAPLPNALLVGVHLPLPTLGLGR